MSAISQALHGLITALPMQRWIATVGDKGVTRLIVHDLLRIEVISTPFSTRAEGVTLA